MKKMNAIIIVILLVVISTIAITSSKYIYNTVWDYYLKSQDFYFESDLLDINEKKNSILKWDGSDIVFSLKNSENSKLISDFDISYKVTCEILDEASKYSKCVLNNTGESSFEGTLSSETKCINTKDETDVSNLSKSECEIGGYEWSKEIVTMDIPFNVILTDQTKTIDELSAKITVESIKPYKKVMYGIFNLNKVEIFETEYILDYQNFDSYDEITLINKIGTDKCFSIKYATAKYLVDSENNDITKYSTDSEGKINEINIKTLKNSSSVFRFYKINNETEYILDDFIIEETKCLES